MTMLRYFENEQIEEIFPDKFVAVFDMNGLIIDDEPIQLKATNLAISHLASEITELDWISCCVGRKPAEYLTDFCPAPPGVGVQEHIKRLVEDKDRRYCQLMSELENDIVRPGVHSFINYLNDRGCATAIATSTTRKGMELILGPRGLNLLHGFDFLICGDQVRRAKPDPEIYLKVRSYFGDSITHVVFEDAAVGVTAAKAAGMICIAVPNKFTMRQNLSGADLKISSFEPFASVLK